VGVVVSSFETPVACGDLIAAVHPETGKPVQAVVQGFRVDVPDQASFAAWLSALGGTVTLILQPVEDQ
jgi:hypothetical protein